MKHFYPRADAIAVPTAAIGDELKAVLNRRRLPIVTLANPVIETIVPAPPRAPGPIRLVSAGRLVEAKGFDLLIDAAALLARRGIDFRLTIHGEGPCRVALEQRIGGLGLGDRIGLPGHAVDLAGAIVGADLFVLASRREGFGNVLIEAMAVGTPVLATRCTGPTAIVTDGIDGFLVARDDAAALADRIAALIACPADRDAVRTAGYALARRFDVAGSTAGFEALVARLI